MKLNIEMTMANLIKRIAISSTRKPGNQLQARVAQEFGSSNLSTSGTRSHITGTTNTLIELSSRGFETKSTAKRSDDRIVSFTPTGDQIKVTKDIRIQSDPNPDYEGDVLHTGDNSRATRRGSVASTLRPIESTVVASVNFDDVTEQGSMRSGYGLSKGESDDEGPLVVQASKSSW